MYLRFCFFFCLVCFSCNSQNTENKNIQVKEMENNNNIVREYTPPKQLNISEFNAKRERSSYRFVDTNGMEVRQIVKTEFPSGNVIKYIEERKYPNSPYTFYSEYGANGNIVKNGTLFYYVSIGINRYYDTLGNVIKKENTDALFHLSIDDLRKKMKDEYDIDIFNTILVGNVNRYFVKEVNMSFYEVEVKDPVVDLIVHIYLIDDSTGKTLLIGTRETEWDGQPEENVLEEYLRKKANGEL